MINSLRLRQIDVFRDAGPQVREAVAARGVLRRYAAGQFLWRAGQAPRGLFVILSGRVRVVGHARGRRHVIHIEGPGATLGEVPLFDGGAYPASAVAAEPTECLVLDKGALRAVIAAQPDLAWLLLARMAGRVRQLIDRLARQTSDPMRVRLATHLLARPVSAAGTITLGGTQEALAEELGTVREVVVRHLRAFIADGWVQRAARREYRIVNTAALAAVASGASGRRAHDGARRSTRAGVGPFPPDEVAP